MDLRGGRSISKLYGRYTKSLIPPVQGFRGDIEWMGESIERFPSMAGNGADGPGLPRCCAT